MTAAWNALVAVAALFAPHTGKRTRRRTALAPWPMAAPDFDTNALEPTR